MTALAARLGGELRRVPIWVIWALGLLPLAWLIVRAGAGGLGVDPVKALEHQLGKLGLQFLLLGLAITPLRRLGLNLIRFRRAVGLIAFTYVLLHVAVWVFLDLQLRWSEIAADLTKRPYIILGMMGLTMLIPLAATSNDLSVRKMGAQRWRVLHRLTYGAALAGILHYVWLVKGWPAEPFIYLAVFGGLMALRFLGPRR